MTLFSRAVSQTFDMCVVRRMHRGRMGHSPDHLLTTSLSPLKSLSPPGQTEDRCAKEEEKQQQGGHEDVNKEKGNGNGFGCRVGVAPLLPAWWASPAGA